MADSRIATVLAADDRFSRPLAATVRSIVSRLSPGRGLDLYLCDMGITAQNREKIAVAAAHPEVRLHWVETLADEVGHLPQASPGISRATYARLFIPWVLPDDLSRALYLDCDLIVRRCVGELFDLPMGDFAALGVADAGSPYVSSPVRRALLVPDRAPGRRRQLQRRRAPAESAGLARGRYPHRGGQVPDRRASSVPGRPGGHQRRPARPDRPGQPALERPDRALPAAPPGDAAI